jgi:uncharacterized protein YuzE
MNQTYLEVTFRYGRAMATYLYLPRRSGQRSYRSIRYEPGLIVDFSRNGKPIGIEITAPETVTVTAMNRVLREFGLATIKRADLAPLRAA